MCLAGVSGACALSLMGRSRHRSAIEEHAGSVSLVRRECGGLNSCDDSGDGRAGKAVAALLFWSGGCGTIGWLWFVLAGKTSGRGGTMDAADRADRTTDTSPLGVEAGWKRIQRQQQ